MRTLTKAKLTDSLVETIGLTHRDALTLIKTFFNDISAALIKGFIARRILNFFAT